MKIEKISDNQIKCTLNKSDLASRQIKISELAYGSEKAKNLFRDMMQLASNELGFEAEDIPLMIEAIPVSSDCIILLITKVEDPEELDTRFSNFAPASDDVEGSVEVPAHQPSAGLLDIIKQVKEELKNAANKNDSTFIPLPEAISDKLKDKASQKTDDKQVASSEVLRIYSFDDIDTLITVANITKEMYSATNSLYKSNTLNKYYLVISQGNHTVEDFNKVCNILLEYGSLEKSTPANEAYFKEHFKRIIARKALQKLLLISK